MRGSRGWHAGRYAYSTNPIARAHCRLAVSLCGGARCIARLVDRGRCDVSVSNHACSVRVSISIELCTLHYMWCGCEIVDESKVYHGV